MGLGKRTGTLRPAVASFKSMSDAAPRPFLGNAVCLGDLSRREVSPGKLERTPTRPAFQTTKVHQDVSRLAVIPIRNPRHIPAASPVKPAGRNSPRRRLGSPGFDAGLTAGPLIQEVEGEKYSEAALNHAVDQATTSGKVRLKVATRSYHRVVELAYDGGLRFPHLEPVEGAPRRLDAIFAPIG